MCDKVKYIGRFLKIEKVTVGFVMAVGWLQLDGFEYNLLFEHFSTNCSAVQV
jgi:hypothetical protein